jgi:sugar phosphate isomerase/epimerase
MLRTVLHSVSYAGFWPGQARLGLDDFLVRARSLGYDGVMLMAKRPHLSALDFDDAALDRLRERVGELGLNIACLAGYTDFTIGSDRPEIPTREMQIVYVTQLARMAERIGCKLVRVFTGYNRSGVSYDQAWEWCVQSLKEASRRGAGFGVTLAVQNHHDTAAHFESFADLLDDVDEPNCQAAFDAWSPALHGSDLVAAVKRLGNRIVHTTVADYVRRPRFSYVPNLVNYIADADAIRAVPMGEGFIDYLSFFAALREVGYTGAVAYEMCSPLRGGGGEANLDRCAKRFLEWMETIGSGNEE